MKPMLNKLMILAVFMAFSAMAQEFAVPPDKEKASYALGMNMGLQFKHGGADIDPNAIAQAIKDVMAGNPTKIQESEIQTILKRAQEYEMARRAQTNKTESAANSTPPAKLPDPPDKEKVSYAIGMTMGGKLKHVDADVDIDTIAQAMKDVLEGKPTKIQESEIMPIFRQAQAYEKARESQKNKAEGEAFLAKNAKAEGVMVLTNGLQYKVLKAGEGEVPKPDELLVVKYTGSFIDGKEFEHNNHFVTRSSVGLQGWQSALQRMKVGSKWQIFVPSDLAFGHQGNIGRHPIGPDATLIYDLELLSILPPGAQIQQVLGTGRLGHGLGDDPESSVLIGRGPATVIQGAKPNALTNAAPPAKNP